MAIAVTCIGAASALHRPVKYVSDVIEDYMEAGLDKETYVDPEIRTLERNCLARKIGVLSDYDRPRFGL